MLLTSTGVLQKDQIRIPPSVPPFVRLSNLPNRKEIANHSRENESGEPSRQT